MAVSPSGLALLLLPILPVDRPEAGARGGGGETGYTVPVVDEGTDTGPVILQRTVRVEPGDTEEALSTRILEQSTWPIRT